MPATDHSVWNTRVRLSSITFACDRLRGLDEQRALQALPMQVGLPEGAAGVPEVREGDRHVRVELPVGGLLDGSES